MLVGVLETENKINGSHLNLISTWVLIAPWFKNQENPNSTSSKHLHPAISAITSKTFNIQYLE